MSNYCKSCRYNYKKTGENACPFNVLYWDFLDRNKKYLSRNHRMGMMFKNLERMDNQTLEEILSQARQVKDKMKSGTL